jgi:DNA-binding protein HU-beta
MAVVNKDELARDVAARSGLEVGQAKRALEATLRSIEEQIGEGNEVRLTGFGKFSVSHRAARQGRNPQTGETMEIAAKSVPRFSAGAELKKAAR